jgi:hypothetical protein
MARHDNDNYSLYIFYYLIKYICFDSFFCVNYYVSFCLD